MAFVTPEIRKCDKEIDATVSAIIREVGHKPKDAIGWQNAWDRFPTFFVKYRAAYLARGIAQIERDEKLQAAALRERAINQIKPARRCPTCGSQTLRAKIEDARHAG